MTDLFGVIDDAELQINVQLTETGPKGDPGEQGPRGLQGPKGDPSEMLPATAETLGGVKVGDNLKIDDGVLSVDTAKTVEQGNTKPVTSSAVKDAYGALSNLDIEALINSFI